MKNLIAFALVWMLTVPVFAQAEQLNDLLARAAPDLPRASVLYLWQDGKATVAARGLLHPDGRDVRATDRFALASVGKLMTSVAVLQMVQAGKLGLDDPAAAHLPIDIVAAFKGLRGVTVRHLLAMQSGLSDYYIDDYLEAVLEDRSAQTIEVALGFATASLKFRPGQRFDYSNTNYLLAQLVLERVSGLTMAAYFKKYFFRPLGMKKAFVFGTRALPGDFVSGFEDVTGAGPEDVSFYYEGNGFGDGAVVASADDLARFYGGLFIDKALLSPPLLKALLTDSLGENYGLGVEVEKVRGIGPVYGHGGGDLGFLSDVRFCTRRGAIAIVLFGADDGDTEVTLDMLRNACG